MDTLWYFAPERNATIQLHDLTTANKLMSNLHALSLCLTLTLTLILQPHPNLLLPPLPYLYTDPYSYPLKP